MGVRVDGEVLGAPAYYARALLAVWLFGFMTGIRSCRKLEVARRDQVPYLWLGMDCFQFQDIAMISLSLKSMDKK